MKIVRGIIKYTLIIIGLMASSFFGKTIFYVMKTGGKTDGMEIIVLLLGISLFVTIQGLFMSIEKNEDKRKKKK